QKKKSSSPISSRRSGSKWSAISATDNLLLDSKNGKEDPFSMRSFYALCPNLFDEVGHIYPYHRALARAVEQNGWIYTNYIPRGAGLKALPPRWIEALPPDFWNRKKGVLFRLRMVFAGFFS